MIWTRWLGEQLRKELQNVGVNIESVDTVHDSSGVALIVTSLDGNNSITVVPAANDKLQPEDIVARKQLISTAGIVLSQLEIPVATVECISHICAQYRIPFILDPAPAQPLPPSL